MELRAYISYRRIKCTLKFWRAVEGQAVDFVIDEILAVEVKATNKSSNSDLKGLRALKEEAVFKNFVCVPNDPLNRERDGIECLHWRTFLERLWAGKYQ